MDQLNVYFLLIIVTFITHSKFIIFKELFRGKLYSNFSFGEVYRRIYGPKFSFTATHERGRQT